MSGLTSGLWCWPPGLADRPLRALLPDDTAYLEIGGGNHAGFGAYGPQRGDGEASLPALLQWDQTAAALAAWVLDEEAAQP